MNLSDIIRNRILKFLRLEKLSENPYAERLTFISDNEQIIKQEIQEYKTWYIGISDELLNYYTNEQMYGNNREPIYNRNRKNYFWGISSEEADIKRVHSGIPNAIITTLVNAIGNMTIKSPKKELQEKIDYILKKTDLQHIINQQQEPLTMVEGWGAFKVNFNTKIAKHPLIEYYEADNVKFVYKSGILIGIIYKDYYKYDNKDYCLLETRRIADGNSIVEYQLFEYNGKNEAIEVELSTIPELADLKDMKIPNLNRILGVPSVFFFNPLNKNYGRSLFAGKVDLFDDLDQILSQDSQTVRVSTPVEYYPTDLLERQSDGLPKMPKAFNRQYVKIDALPNGDGETNGAIQTTQPNLNFEQYSANAKSKLDFILTGILSPATMGIDIAKKDNADAQREKEKVTIMTRNNIIDRQVKILNELMELLLMVQEYIDTGDITIQEYDLSIKYDEFANPSFENELQVLGSAWSDGQLSTKKYVDLLWKDNLSEEEKAIEIEELEKTRNQDNLKLGDFEDENPIRFDLQEEEETDIQSQEH